MRASMVIRLSRNGQLTYSLFNHIVILLLLWGITHLLAMLQAIPLITLPIDFARVSAYSLTLLILTGWIAGGALMGVDALNTLLFRWSSRLWMGVSGVVIVVSGWWYAPIIDLLPMVGLSVFLRLSIYAHVNSRFVRIWQLGMLLLLVSLVLRFVNSHPALTYLTLYVAHGITATSITFWLMTRWSRVRAQWAEDGVVIVAGLVTVAGLLISFAPIAESTIYKVFAIAVISVCYTILGGHHYRALRDRNHDMSLSAHWIAVAVILWLSVGFIGIVVVMVTPVILSSQAFMDAHISLLHALMITIVLGLVNYGATYLRGENRRVTGYMPLWLMSFGLVWGHLVALSRGVVDIYLHAILVIDHAQVASLLLPLTLVIIGCWVVVALGIGIYALGYTARRPRIVSE